MTSLVCGGELRPVLAIIATGRAKVDLTVCDKVALTSAGLCPKLGVGDRQEDDVDEDDDIDVLAGCGPKSVVSSTFGMG